MKRKNAIILAIASVLTMGAASLSINLSNKTTEETVALSDDEHPSYIYVNMDMTNWLSWGAKYGTTDTGGSELKMFAWGNNVDNGWPGQLPEEIVTGQNDLKYAKFNLNTIFGGNDDSSRVTGFLLTVFNAGNVDCQSIDMSIENGKDVVYVDGKESSGSGKQHAYYAPYKYEDITGTKTIRLFDANLTFSKNAKIFSWNGDGTDPSAASWPGADMTTVTKSYNRGHLYSYTFAYNRNVSETLVSGFLFNSDGDNDKTNDMLLLSGKTTFVMIERYYGFWMRDADFNRAISFIFDIMKMEQYQDVETTSECQTNYDAAKTAYANLNSECINCINYINSDTWVRLSKWAIANHETFDKDAGTFTPTQGANMNLFRLNDNNSLLTMVIIVSIAFASGVSIVLLKRKAHN